MALLKHLINNCETVGHDNRSSYPECSDAENT